MIANLVVTGNQNTFYVGSYQSLKEAYIDPRPVFERVRIDRFVGREWLSHELDDFLQSNDRGYVILEAKAGLGKTSFLAHLVKERGWVSHFVELAPGADGIIPARKHLAAQLVRAFELGDGDRGAGLPDQASSRPDFLAALLRDACEQRAAGEKIVVVVDGLDESAARPGENVLGLPDVLPAGVFIVCSTRPGPLSLNVQRPRRVLTVDPNSKNNRDDIRVFLSARAASEPLRTALKSSGHQDDFVDRLMAKSAGVWVYLHYVVTEIEDGHRPLDLEALPEGLADYYAKFWRSWKSEHESQWRHQHLPLLATLAAAQSPLTSDLLRRFAGLNTDATEELPDQWRPFLDVQRGDERRYRLYHRSLKDFLHGRDEDDLLEDERDFADELAAAAARAHLRIAERYLKAWGGLEAGLPGLIEADARDLDGGYGLRHVIQHLVTAREHDAHSVLRLEQDTRTGSANVWFATHETVDDIAGYLGDIALAWDAAQGTTRQQLARGESASGAALEYGYALITASVNTLAQRIPSALRVALLGQGIWSPRRALTDAERLAAYERVLALGDLAPCLTDDVAEATRRRALQDARAIADEETRAKALVRFAARVPERDRAGVLTEALQAALAIRNELSQSWVLGELAARGPEALVGQVLQAARAMSNDDSRAQVLIKLTARVPEALASQILEDARAMSKEGSRAELLGAIAERVPERDREGVRAEALLAARAISSDEYRAWVLGELAARMPYALVDEALQDARAISDKQYGHWSRPDEIQHKYSRAWVLTRLAERVPERNREGLLAEALRAARAISAEAPRARMIGELAERVPERDRERVLAEALRAARAISNDESRARALGELAERVLEPDREGVLAEALQAARAISIVHTGVASYENTRAKALAGLAERVPERDREGVLAEALRAARAISDEAPRARMLGELAERVPERDREGVLAAALRAARAISDEAPRARMIGELAEHVPERDREGVLAEALGAARAISDGDRRAWVLGELAGRLPKALVDQALHDARAIPTRYRAWVLGEVAAGVPEDDREGVLAEALRAARASFDEDTLVKVLAALAERVPERDRDGVLAEALQAAHAISNANTRAELLSALAERVPQRDREGVLAAALRAARAISDEAPRARMIGELAERVPEPDRDGLLAEALQAGRAISNDVSRAEVLGALAKRVPARDREGVLAEALRAARAISEDDSRARTLAALAERVPALDREGLLAEALEAARAISDDDRRARVLGEELAWRLPEALVDQALHDARAIPTRHRGWVLGELAAGVPEALAEHALHDVRAISEQAPRAKVLGALAERVPARDRERVLAEALQAARAISDDDSRARMLAALAERVPERDREGVLAEALRAARAISDDERRARVLSAMAQGALESTDRVRHRVWIELVIDAAKRARPPLFSSKDILKYLEALVDDAGAADAVHWIERVARWWP